MYDTSSLLSIRHLLTIRSHPTANTPGTPLILALPVYFSPVANGDNKNQQLVIMNLIDDSARTYSNTPTGPT